MVYRALTRKDAPQFPQRGHGGALALLALSPLRQPAAYPGKQKGEGWRHALSLQIRSNPCALSAVAISGERLNPVGAEQLCSPLKWWIGLNRCNHAACCPEFCFSGCYLCDTESFLKIQIAVLIFQRLFFAPPEKWAGEWKNTGKPKLLK